MNEEVHPLYGYQDSRDDLVYALENNTTNVKLEEIDGIIAEVPGANDELEWHWVIKLTNGLFGYLHGGCDYTGWD